MSAAPASGKEEVEIDLDNPPFQLTAIDRKLLSMKDEDFHRLTWEDLKRIIASNRLDELVRLPSDLRVYLTWAHQTKQQYGSITNFIIQKRLCWMPIADTGPPRIAHYSSVPFQDPQDYAVLINDFPYGLDEGIVHLLAWSKTPIPFDNGEATPASRRLIQDFMDSFFLSDLKEGNDKVIWFINSVNLQSVRGVDHVHIFVRDVPETILREWTSRRDL